ncbi:hypothetical protein SH09_13960, partial [Staphylococcus gallinarum]
REDTRGIIIYAAITALKLYNELPSKKFIDLIGPMSPTNPKPADSASFLICSKLPKKPDIAAVQVTGNNRIG